MNVSMVISSPKHPLLVRAIDGGKDGRIAVDIEGLGTWFLLADDATELAAELFAAAALAKVFAAAPVTVQA